MVFGIILIGLGVPVLFLWIKEGGGKAGEAFTLFAYVIGWPALILGIVMVFIGIRRNR